MGFDESLATRVRRLLGKREGFTEKKMFGGLAFLCHGNMCCGIHKYELIVRLAPAESEAALAEPDTRVFDLTGRPMKGWVLVEASGLEDEKVLSKWVGKAVKFASSLPTK